MIDTLVQTILEQLDQPKKDIEHNVRALLSELMTKMNVVSQEELNRQRTALNKANQRLTELQQQLQALEQQMQHKN